MKDLLDKESRSLLEGCDWYDIIEVSGENIPVSFRNNRLHTIMEKQNRGFGIRLNIDGKTGFSYTNSREKINEAVRRAEASSLFGETEKFRLPGEPPPLFDPYSGEIEDFDTDGETGKGEAVIKSIREDFPDANIDLSINRSVGSVRIVNSGGLDISYKNSYFSASVSATLLLEEGTKVDVWEGKSSLKPEEISDLRDRVKEKLGYAMTVRPVSSGKMKVILTPKAAASLMRIVIGGFNGRSVWKGISPFCDRAGEKIFSPRLSICDDPGLSGSPYSYPFDDEGIAGRKKFLINRGVVETFITDLKYSERLNQEPTGNGSRGYSSLPSPSFSNIIVEGGERSIRDIMGDTGEAILVDQFIGLGQSNTLTGEFSAGLDLAFLLVKGEPAGRVKDCMITGNLFHLLSGDPEFSSERERKGSTLVPYICFPSVDFTS